ncbi:MAG: dTDP-4-dehydrorhamnose reductase [Candidatus Neomarinimicrobiota bacterium]
MRILITGAFGQLGHTLQSILSKKSNYELICTGRKIKKGQEGIPLDIRNQVALKELINTTAPDILINLAAMTNVDACELNPKLAGEINVAGLEHICDSFQGKIIHLSTDYVFDGTSGPYKEDDPLNPISIYGKTKLASEHILLEKDIKNLVIRGNVLYDYSPHTSASFLNWVVSSLKGNQEIKVVEDQFNNPTWTRSMCDIIKLSIENDLEGIIHWGDSVHISRFEFAKLIAKKFSLNESLIKPVLTSELNQPARRPLQSGLSTKKLVNMLDIIPPSIDDCLDEIIKTIQ